MRQGYWLSAVKGGGIVRMIGCDSGGRRSGPDAVGGRERGVSAVPDGLTPRKLAVAAAGSLVELPWSPPPHGGDRRALGLHIGLCGCLQGETGKLAPAFVAATLFSGLRVKSPQTFRTSKWRCCGFSARPPRTSPLRGGRVDTEGISGTPGFPTGTSGLLSPLRRSGHGKAMGYPEESPAPQACRVHLGGRGHRMTRKVQKMSGLRMPGGVPGPSFL